MTKFLLLDVDGVLLNWQEGFTKYLRKIKHIKYMTHEEALMHIHVTMYDAWGDNKLLTDLVTQFNESEDFGKLKPLFSNAPKDLMRLKDHFYFTVHAITSASDNPNSKTLRENNLRKEYPGLIDKLIMLPLGGDKRLALSQYPKEHTIFIDDNMKNVNVGESVGHRTFYYNEFNFVPTIIPHPWQQWIDTNNIKELAGHEPTVWEDFHHHLIKNP